MLRQQAGLLVMVVLVLAGCAGDSDVAPPEPGVAGTLNGEPITNDEVIDLLAQQQNDLVRSAVKAVATNRLIDEAAKSRGMTTEQLFQLEVAGKVVPPTEEEARAFFEARKTSPQLADRTFEQVRPQIAQFLMQQKQMARHAAYLRELGQDAKVRVLIDVPRVDVTIPASAPSKGPADAAVTIVEFADFECPACRDAQSSIDRLLTEFDGRVRLVFRDFPLSNHLRAVPASTAAWCAAAQDRFWDYHRSLMEGPLEDVDLKRRAADLGLDVAQFISCYDARSHAAEIQDGFNQGRSLDVTSTPTFFVNGRKVVGLPAYEDLKEIVEEELERGGEG